jgi:glycine/D-amino acid oxidase-like deaminating enzyme/nitrite reductase/ring-hydroxylating ferredoxin subunit
MDSTSGHTQSIWLLTSPHPARSPLDQDIRADVCIVGAGITGLTTAYLLTGEGRSVVVIDDGDVGSGETGRTTAHLVNALDDRYYEIERLHGEKGARLAAESHSRAIDRIESIVHDAQIDCGFERLDGYLFVQEGDKKTDLDRELEAVHRAGLVDVTRLERAPLRDFDTGPCLRFPRQAQFHPLLYLEGLARAIEGRGGRIFTGTHVNAFEDRPSPRVETRPGHVVTARAIVVATNTPVNDRVAIHTKQAAYRTYVVGLRVPPDTVRRALYWDSGDPYHYVRLGSGPGAEDLLIVGGEDHKTGQADDSDQRFARLEEWTRTRFPSVGAREFAWSGQVMEPIDSLAFIGRNPGDANVYVATGDSGNGMTHGTIAGLLIADLIQDRENEWASLYDPGRITLRAAAEFAKENINVAVQYADLVSGGDVANPSEIKPGSGAVVREGLKKLAVYRDESGVLHRYSAICPHLGCVVDWNAIEKTWDCPCHGSRFDANGHVLNGPAISDLSAEPQ